MCQWWNPLNKIFPNSVRGGILIRTILFNFVSILHEKSVRMNKNQLVVWGSAVSSPSGPGAVPESFVFFFQCLFNLKIKAFKPWLYSCITFKETLMLQEQLFQAQLPTCLLSQTPFSVTAHRFRISKARGVQRINSVFWLNVKSLSCLALINL